MVGTTEPTVEGARTGPDELVANPQPGPAHGTHSEIRPLIARLLLGLRKRSDMSRGDEPEVPDQPDIDQDPMAKKPDKPADFLEHFEQDPDVPPMAWRVGPTPSRTDPATKVRPLSKMSDVENFDADVKSVIDAVRGK